MSLLTNQPNRRAEAGRLIAGAVAAAVVIAASSPAPVAAQPQSVYIYAKVDHQNHSAHMYYFKPDTPNAGWKQFDETGTKTDQVKLSSLLNGCEDDDYVYFLGVKSTTVIEGDVDEGDSWWDTRIDHFNDDEYTELNHHMVVKADPVASNRSAADPCNKIYPIAAGSEFTSYEFPKDGSSEYTHAMEFLGGDKIGGAAWHWGHTGVNPTYDVYIEFEILLDWDSQPIDYEDVNVSWLSAQYCGYTFCLDDGEQTKTGSYTAPVDGQIILAMPHVHDHAEAMTLQINSQTVTTATPTNSPTYETMHDCDHEDESDDTDHHTHSGHLKAGGLEDDVYAPGNSGPYFYEDDTLQITATFDVPVNYAVIGGGGSVEVPIDEMAIWMVFWAPQ